MSAVRPPPPIEGRVVTQKPPEPEGRSQRLELVSAAVAALLLLVLPPLPSAGDAPGGRGLPVLGWNAAVGAEGAGPAQRAERADRAGRTDGVEGRPEAAPARDRPAAPGVLRIHLHPAGSDDADGLSAQTPVRSLDRAQRIIAALRPRTDVEVRISPGIYIAPPVRWTTYVPGHSITFLPEGYEYEATATGGVEPPRPVFRGDGRAGFWFVAALPHGHRGGDLRLRFYHLQVERYSGGGITIDGGVAPRGGVLRPASAGHNRNTVYGMVFRQLGSKHVRSGTGYGAIDLINSRSNVIQNNRFERIENSGSASDKALVHGVYLAHGSSDNVIQSNRFTRISGDPIRTRNASGDNHMSGNVFVRAGANAYLSDWFVAAPSPGAPRECPSRGNQFYGNTLRSGYSGEIETWTASPPTIPSAVRRSCSEKSGKRVRAWGNGDAS